VGVPVDLTITGTQRTLPPGLELCAYRVIQESLTNVLKHAGPAQVTIELHYSPDVFRARISDNGRGPDADRDQPRNDRSGHGLSGMRERAKLYRGTVTAAARAEGGFEVELVLPLAASTAVDTDAV
jgi:signal transduction histidine kinase